MWQYLKVFAFGFMIDTAYVLYILMVAEGNKLAAAITSIAVAAPGLFGFIAVNDDHKMAIPYLSGLFLGTIFAMYLKGWIF